MRLILVITARCNAQCDHCSKSYGPTRSQQLPLEQTLNLMRDAAGIDDAVPLAFDITGGEPFLDFSRLEAIVAEGGRLGGEVTCVTNGYWARTDEVAHEKLSRLKILGLSGLGISVSRFHQQFIPLGRAKRALDQAMRLGISTELKAAVTNRDLEPGGILTQWQSQLNAEWVNMFPVLPHLRTEVTLPAGEYYREAGLPKDRCPGDSVCVDYSGIARSCCSLGTESDFLTLGDTRSEPLEEIHERFRTGCKQKILREAGPIAFAMGAEQAGFGHRLRTGYAGPCDLCLHIRTDPQLRAVAEEMAASVEASSAAVRA